MKKFLDIQGLSLYDQKIKDYIGSAVGAKADDSVFGASGNDHSKGLVPDPGATAGSTKYLREDGTWAVPAGGSGGGGGDVNVIETVKVNGNALTPDANKAVDITIPDSVFGASGTNHSTGLVPDPGATQGTTKYLREDGTWAVPAGGSGGGGGDVNVIESISVNNVNISPDANKNVNITISTASSIADNEQGFTTGDQVYDYVQAQIAPIQLILDNAEAVLATI